MAMGMEGEMGKTVELNIPKTAEERADRSPIPRAPALLRWFRPKHAGDASTEAYQATREGRDG